MSGEWIKLVIHPEHPKIRTLAFLVGINTRSGAERVFCCAVRWFRYIDQHLGTERTNLPADAIHDICGWQPEGQREGARSRLSLVEAMSDARVGWLAPAGDGTFIIPEYESHFSQSAKRRARDAIRKSEFRPQTFRDGADDISISSSSGSVPSGTLSFTLYGVLYNEYPRAARGNQRDFGIALTEGAWNVLLARGEPDPCRVLRPIVRAYNASWLVRNDRGVLGPARFFAVDGEWTRDPADWSEPKSKPKLDVARAAGVSK